MNVQNAPSDKKLQNIRIVTAVLVFGVIVLAVGLVAVQVTTGTSPLQVINNFLGLDSVHIWWYISRASGLMAYLLVWLSTLWGFAISSKVFDSFLKREFTYDFHEHLSLLGLGFVLVHVAVLLFDKYLPFSLVQLLIPFTGTYRPFWVGLGIISLYVLLPVTFTFYLRQKIGSRAFRSIHLLSLVSYLGTTLHGFFAGTDSALPITMLLYAGTFLVVVFLTAYWLIMRTFKKEVEHVTVTQISNRKMIGSTKR